MNINLPEIFFTELEKLYVEHLISKLNAITTSFDTDIDPSKPEYEKQKALLDQLKVLYAKLKGFNDTFIPTVAPSKNENMFSDYHKWFDDIITLWFKVIGIETRKGIVKAVKLDEKLNLEGTKHTSSVADTSDLLYVLLIEFKQIVGVDHDKSFMIASEIVSVSCFFFYCFMT